MSFLSKKYLCDIYDENTKITFINVLHYECFKKAEFFNELFCKLNLAKKTNNNNVILSKSLLLNFSSIEWKKKRKEILIYITIEKFKQNKGLFEKFMNAELKLKKKNSKIPNSYIKILKYSQKIFKNGLNY